VVHGLIRRAGDISIHVIAGEDWNGASSKKPAPIAYSVKLDDGTPIWTRIGAAWRIPSMPSLRVGASVPAVSNG
jgi:hypothetical protein